MQGVQAAGDGQQIGLISEEVIRVVAAPQAPASALVRVHDSGLLERLERLSASGGGSIDQDTIVSSHSDGAARRAAGAGLDLIRRLDGGEADVGWSVVRPPGHHATFGQQMGFCLINNVAVAARHLADRGERVAIVDLDVHHGNGTQQIFESDPDVLFVSLHQFPWYPFSGSPEEVGDGDGLGTTVNVALSAGADGLIVRRAIDDVVAPAIARHDPSWLLISIGFDGHRDDPLAQLELTSGDYGQVVAELLSLVPAGRRLMFLEGGYDLAALRRCSEAVASAAIGNLYSSDTTASGEAPSGAGRRPENCELEGIELARAIHQL